MCYNARMTLLPEKITLAFPRRPDDLHKHTAGTVTVVGGSHRFVHAPAIAGLGARAAGAGLVHLVVPDASRIPAAVLVPEATFLKQTAACVPPKADVTVIGMGLGVTPASERLVSRLLSGSPGCFLIDADALTLLANRSAQDPKGFLVAEGQTLILTPHVGEAARLLACKSSDIQADRNTAAQRIVAHYHALCVLKGAHTVVAAPDGRTFTCEAGNPFMAMGGMGDLLAGVIAARWAYLKDPFRAACSAVWLHAAAADELVSADPPVDPSLVNTAAKIGSLRVSLERK